MQYNDKDEAMCMGGCPYWQYNEAPCNWKLTGGKCPTKEDLEELHEQG